MDELLPLGSVISLIGEEEQQFLVIGYYPEDEEESYDYLLTLYPQGMFEFPYTVVANSETIENVCITGFANEASREMLSGISEFIMDQAELNAEIGGALLRYSEENPEEFRNLVGEFEGPETTKPYSLE